MRLKMIIDEDFSNYVKPSMFLSTVYCDWKCCKELNLPTSICQNNHLENNLIFSIDDVEIIERYIKNVYTSAIVIGGLEPFLQFEELTSFINILREHCDDEVIIYTGYYKDEIQDKIDILKQYKNIIIKFGRYIPNIDTRFDPVLKVVLASSNQYAERIS